ncbi:NfeD family protein, partial [Mordavella massiliensis]
GQDWSARTKEPDGRIAKDTVVTIEEIQGVHLIVKPREEQTC